jgi:pSer/pThr/pTyr-binding forkhead associated (FHA) protein
MVMEERVEAGNPGLPADFVPLRLILRTTGAAVELTRPDMVLGRHSEADIRLPLPDVSRRHCRFYFQDGSWHIKDLKSLNGTFLNDEPVEESPICHGDTLRIGGFVFSVEGCGVRQKEKTNMILSITRILPSGPSRQAG